MNTGNDLNPLLTFAIVLAVFPVFAAFLTFILRYTSCWNRLEKLYLVRKVSLKENFGLQIVNIASPFDPGGVFNRFGWTIKVGANDSGVFLSGIFPLDRILRPVVIPWDELIIVEQSFIGLNRNELIPTQLPEIQIILRTPVANKLRNYFKSR